MSRWTLLTDGGIAAAVALVYFAAGKLGLSLAFVNQSASAVWPATGIALAAFLLLGRRIWPAVLAGAFFVNLTTTGEAVTSMGIAIGNTLEGLVGSALILRFAGGRSCFDHPKTVFRFVLGAVLVAPMISASFGATLLALGNLAKWEDFGPVWITWWLGDAAGAMIAFPVLILWAQDFRFRWTAGQTLEAAAVAVATVLVSLFIFAGWNPFADKNLPIAFLCIPFIFWPAFRFGSRETATGMGLVSAIAVWGTLGGAGPFGRASPHESLLVLQIFMGVVTSVALCVAAALQERRRTLESVSHLASIIQTTDDSIYSVSGQGSIVSWNAGAAKLFGYEPEQAIGRSVEIILPEDRKHEPSAVFEKLVRGERVEQLETTRVTREGRRIEISMTASSIRDGTGRVIGVSVISRDITARKQIDRLKDEFVSTVSHELRTPLTSIYGSLRLMAGGMAGDMSVKARTLIDVACRNSDRLTRLISDLLDLSKFESGGMTLSLRPLDVPAFVKAFHQNHRVFAEEHQVTLILERPLPNVKIRADHDRLSQVLANLLSNAVKFSPPQGIVRVSARLIGTTIRFTVTDQGPGVPPEFRSRIFQKFAQADARQKGGTGLGLSIAKAIIEKHGGTIGFDSEPGRPTIFYVDLPEWRPVASEASIRG